MNIDFTSLKNWALLVAGLLIVVDVIVIIAKAKSGSIRDSAVTIVIIAIAAVALAIGTHFQEFSDFLWNLFTG